MEETKKEKQLAEQRDRITKIAGLIAEILKRKAGQKDD